VKQKIEQLNQSYRKALGQVLQSRYANEGVIVDDVLLDPSLQHGRAWLICDQSHLTDITKNRSEIQRSVQEFLKTRYTPKIDFQIKDSYLDKMDRLFETVKKDEN